MSIEIDEVEAIEGFPLEPSDSDTYTELAKNFNGFKPNLGHAVPPNSEFNIDIFNCHASVLLKAALNASVIYQINCFRILIEYNCAQVTIVLTFL